MKDSKKLVPYSTYFRCFTQLIHGTTAQVVFLWLMGECRISMKLTGKYSCVVKYSSNEIYRRTNITRRAVNAAIDYLETIGLVSDSDTFVVLNLDLYVSVVKHFLSLQSNKQKEFADAFAAHGIKDIPDFEIEAGSGKELMDASGNTITFGSSLSKMMHICAKKHKDESNDASVSQMIQLCAKKHKDESNDTALSQIAQPCAKWLNAVSNSTTIIREKFGIGGFDVHFRSLFLDYITESEYIDIRTRIFSNGLEDVVTCHPVWVVFFAQLSTISGVSQIAQGGESNSTAEVLKPASNDSTVIIGNIKKEMNEQGSKNEVEKAEEKPVSKRSKFFDKVEVPDFSSENNNDFEEPASRSSQKVKRDYGYSNPYRNKPFLSEAKLRLISQGWNDNETVTSPAKFFVWMLYWGICDLYANSIENNEEDMDDDGNYHQVSDDVIEERIKHPFAISKDDISQLLDDICNDMDGAVDKGYYEAGDKKYIIGFDNNHGINPDYLFDWDDCRDLNGLPAYRIDITKLRDIEAPDATEIKQPQTREEKKQVRRENLAYFTTIMQADDSQLTELERMIRDFANDFFIYDEDRAYEVKGFLNGRGDKMMDNELPAWLIKPWAVRHSSDNVHPSDLYSVFNADYADGQILHWQSTVFSFMKAKRWHEMNGIKSEIIAQLQETRPDE